MTSHDPKDQGCDLVIFEMPYFDILISGR